MVVVDGVGVVQRMGSWFLVCVQRMGSWFWHVLRYDVIRGSLGKPGASHTRGQPGLAFAGFGEGVVGAPRMWLSGLGRDSGQGPSRKTLPPPKIGGILARLESSAFGLLVWRGVLPCFALCRARVCFGGHASMWGACCRVRGAAWGAAGGVRQMAPTGSRAVCVRCDAEGLSGPTGDAVAGWDVVLFISLDMTW